MEVEEQSESVLVEEQTEQAQAQPEQPVAVSGTATNMSIDIAFQNVTNAVRDFKGTALQHELLVESLIVIRNHLQEGQKYKRLMESPS